MSKYLTITLSLLLILSCSSDAETVNEGNSVTEADAVEFLAEVEERAKTEGPIYSSAFWIQSNFITYDSQRVAADYSKRGTLIALEQARIASSFDELDLDPADRRALNIIKNGFVMPPPLDEELAGEMATIMTELESMYGNGSHCFSENDCYDLEAFENIIDNSRDPDELLRAWSGWREIGDRKSTRLISSHQ